VRPRDPAVSEKGGAPMSTARQEKDHYELGWPAWDEDRLGPTAVRAFDEILQNYSEKALRLRRNVRPQAMTGILRRAISAAVEFRDAQWHNLTHELILNPHLFLTTFNPKGHEDKNPFYD
jgi:hypothetical protein